MPVFFEISSRVINGHPIANGGCPLYPQKQTRSSSASLSAKCHERKSRHELLLSDRRFYERDRDRAARRSDSAATRSFLNQSCTTASCDVQAV